MYPPGIVTRTCTVGGATAQESGDPLVLSVVVASSRGLIWASTGWRLPSLPRTVASTVGTEVTFELPVTSQAGFRSDSSPGTIIDVSAPGSYSHTYTATVTITTPTGGLVSQHVIGPFPLPAGDLSPVDLDTMLPVATVAGGAVLVPATWDARVAAAEAVVAAITPAGQAITQAVDAEAQRAALHVGAAPAYGLHPTRETVALIGGRTSAYANVTTPIPSGTQTAIPLGELIDVSGLSHVGDTIVIPTSATLGECEIEYSAQFSGGTSGSRELRLLVNGVLAHVAQGYGSSVTVTGRLPRRRLGGGSVVSLAAYTGDSGVKVTATADTVWLRVRHSNPPSVTPAALGWSWPADVPDLPDRRVYGFFMDRLTWAGIAAPLSSNAGFNAWVAANPDRAADIAGPLVPNHAVGVNLDAEFDAVIAGSHDGDYAVLGAALATYGPATVYFRPFPEFNYTIWAMTPAKFIAAWQRAIPLIRAAFATAARPGQVLRIVWCFGGDGLLPLPWWPGTDHVDVVSVDTYLKRFGTPATIGSVLLQVSLDLSRAASIAATYNKPLAISEWANVAVGPSANNWHGMGDWVTGVDYVLDWVERAGIAYAVYFNLNRGGVGQFLSDVPLTRARLAERSARLTDPAS